VARLAEQLREDPEEIRSYGRRAKTRTDHLRLAAQHLGWSGQASTTMIEIVHLSAHEQLGCSSKSRPQQPRANEERHESSRSAVRYILRG
jgi:hypothetical protein